LINYLLILSSSYELDKINYSNIFFIVLKFGMFQNLKIIIVRAGVILKTKIKITNDILNEKLLDGLYYKNSII